MLDRPRGKRGRTVVVKIRNLGRHDGLPSGESWVLVKKGTAGYFITALRQIQCIGLRFARACFG
jgi:hypothetical protein